MTKEQIGEKIRELRKKTGMSQQALADRIGVARNTIARHECGRNYPAPDLIAAIAEALGVTTDEILVANSKDPQPQKPEVEDVVQLAVSLNPESLKLGKAYLQALHDVERANNRKP